MLAMTTKTMAHLLELLLQGELIGGDELLVQQHTCVASEHELAHLLSQLLDLVRGELLRGAEEDTADLQRTSVDLCECREWEA